MGIGDNNNSGSNSNNGKLFENTYYSRLKVKNPESKLSLTPSFKSGLLVLSIVEQKDGFKYDTLEEIHLSSTKAKLLALEIEKYKNYLSKGDIIPGKAFGVNAGMGEKVTYIGIHANENMRTIVTIGKIDGSGNIIEKAEIALNKDYHYALEWDNIDNMDVAKSTYDGLELDQIRELCEDFGRHMNGAIAYSVADLTRYDNARILGKMDPIYDKLGIERRSYNGNSNRGSNNFMNNLGNTDSNHTSMDNIEDMME